MDLGSFLIELSLNLSKYLDFLFQDFRIDPAYYVWELIGFVGEGIFFSRFVVQWIATERKKRTVVPLSFWYLSILGSAIILAYALHKNSAVFTVATIAGMLIYFRNLHIAHRHKAQSVADG
jgi:lipid-A-disaccharide synthase-like uncharacterized protein